MRGNWCAVSASMAPKETAQALTKPPQTAPRSVDPTVSLSSAPTVALVPARKLTMPTTDRYQGSEDDSGNEMIEDGE